MGEDAIGGPLVKYFSFIALGLAVTIGYAYLRIAAARNKKREAQDLTLVAMEAEREARRIKDERAREAPQQTVEEEPKDDDGNAPH